MRGWQFILSEKVKALANVARKQQCAGSPPNQTATSPPLPNESVAMSGGPVLEADELGDCPKRRRTMTDAELDKFVKLYVREREALREPAPPEAPPPAWMLARMLLVTPPSELPVRLRPKPAARQGRSEPAA